MSDITLGMGLIPDSTDEYNLGSEEKKWKIYGRNYGTISHNKDLVTKEYADGIIQVSETQPTIPSNQLWVNEVAGVPVEIPTMQEALALGISEASVGQGIKINSVDGDGVPVTWAATNFVEKNQGAANVGKILVVNNEGNLVLMTKSEWEALLA